MIKADSSTGLVERKGGLADLITDTAMIGYSLKQTLPDFFHPILKKAFEVGMTSQDEDEMKDRLEEAVRERTSIKPLSGKEMGEAIKSVIEALGKAIDEESDN